MGVDRLRQQPAAAPDPAEAASSSDRTIVVDAARIDGIATARAEALGRPPSPEELDAAVRAFVDEEILVREARRRGLDADDPIIRARLARKQVFLTQALAMPPEPTDAELQALWERVQDDYRVAARVTVRQLWVDGDDVARAELLAARWRAGEDGRTLGEEADTPPGGPVLRLRSPEHLALQLGDEAAAEVLALAEGEIAVVPGVGGVHVFRVEARREGGPMAFEDARLRLTVQWKAAWIQAATDEALAGLRDDYEVVGWP